jgi:O-antigen ligase
VPKEVVSFKNIPLGSLRQIRSPESVARFLASLLLILTIIFPTAFQLVKAGILIIVLFIVVRGLLLHQLQLSSTLYFFSLIYGTIGIGWSLYGEVMENPGALRVVTVMVIYPLLIPLFCTLYKRGHENGLYRIFLISAWVLIIVDLLYVITGLIFPENLLESFFDLLYEESAVINDGGTYIKFTLPNIASIIFLLPFFLASLFFHDSGNQKSHIFIIVLLLLVVAVLSGRRALLLSALIGPATAFLLTLNNYRTRQKGGVSRRRWPMLVMVFFMVSLIYPVVVIVGMEHFVELVTSIFDFSENSSNLERVHQFSALKQGIVEAPLFGHGAGAVADYIRSEEMPWAYELFYVSIMFQYGIVGFLFYSVGVAFLAFYLISAVREKGRASFEFYFLSGFIAFMIATASNPYLAKFDYMWVIFIPYALVNFKLVSSKNKSAYGLAHGS